MRGTSGLIQLANEESKIRARRSYQIGCYTSDRKQKNILFNNGSVSSHIKCYHKMTLFQLYF